MNLKDFSDKRKKKLLIILTAAVISALGIGAAVYARYIRNSNKEENTLSPARSIQPTIFEEFGEHDNLLKKNVYFNVGYTYYPVYIRAAIIYTWKEKDTDNGVLYFEKPEENSDYKLSWNDTDWSYSDPNNGGDGYYYYNYPVKSEGTTKVLINECEQLHTFVDEMQGREYTLNVEVIAQTVQAVGHTDGNDGETLMSVQDAWEHTPDLELNETFDDD